MRNIIIGLLAMSSLSTLASTMRTPRESSVVKSIQKSFVESVAPTESDLDMGRKWKCVSFSTTQGQSRVSGLPSYFLFTSVDGIIKNEGTANAKNLVYENSGLIGPNLTDNDGSLIVVRVSAKGDLISEYSIPNDALARYRNAHTYVTPSVYDNHNMVISYQICPKISK